MYRYKRVTYIYDFNSISRIRGYVGINSINYDIVGSCKFCWTIQNLSQKCWRRFIGYIDYLNRISDIRSHIDRISHDIYSHRGIGSQICISERSLVYRRSRSRDVDDFQSIVSVRTDIEIASRYFHISRTIEIGSSCVRDKCSRNWSSRIAHIKYLDFITGITRNIEMISRNIYSPWIIKKDSRIIM